MKKSSYIFLMSCLACLSVYAMLDEPVKILRIFNGGVGTSIQLSHVDSLLHSTHNSGRIQSVVYAFDSIYRIPIHSIDSIVVEEVNVDEIQENLNSISDYSGNHDGQGEDDFKDGLCTWLNSQDWVDHTSPSEDGGTITVTNTNGVNSYVFFQDCDFFNQPSGGAKPMMFGIQRAASNVLSIDVSSLNNEEIIDKKRILYFYAHEMDWMTDLLDAMVGEEYPNIQKECNEAPVDVELKKVSKSLGMFNEKEDLSKYAVAIIGHTHGVKSYPGSFLVEDGDETSIDNRGICMYVNDGILQDAKNENLFLVKPQVLRSMVSNKYPILFGNYCWSYFMSDYLPCPVVGYQNYSQYIENNQYSALYLRGLLNGLPHADVVAAMYSYQFKGENVKAATNRPNSKQRFFSIKTNDITEFSSSGNAIVKGKINGYANLKSNITYYAYIFGQDEAFNPEDIPTKGQPITVNADGTFSHECTQAGAGKYQVVIGFSYAGKYYYGEPKNYEITQKPLCPDGNHPHMIDLGLPDGTKWACCNVGASSPEGYGGYYAWGETSEKNNYDRNSYSYYNDQQGYINIGSEISGTGYDAATANWGSPWRMPTHDEQVKLLVNCTSEWTQVNGVSGRKFTGPNGNCIFLPAAGYRWDDCLYYEGGLGYNWSGTLHPDNIDGDGAYGLYFDSGYAGWHYGYGRSYGFSVRPVAE